MSDSFFQTAKIQIFLKTVIDLLEKRPGNDRKANLLRSTIDIITSNAKEFDEKCGVNINWIGSKLAEDAQLIASGPLDETTLDDFYASIYRFVVEFELSNTNDLSFDLRAFAEFSRMQRNEFKEEAQRTMSYADQSMPIAIIKNLLGNDLLSNIKSVEKYSELVEGKFSKWENNLAEREVRADQLKGSLEKYTTGFNFVGLYDGFNLLTTEKTEELKKSLNAQIFMGSLAILPTLIELMYIFFNITKFDQIKFALLASAVPAISLTVLLVYFFRLSVRSVDSCKSQILQLELRKTLCRFVQNYVEYVGKLKPEERESVAKFETVVFSGIVASDEKIPATFDGLDQLTKLVKVARGN